jgi:meso-butanediol dehydrogenase/(S,S)-butanediol dehydrogenase/diacetyl reductase
MFRRNAWLCRLSVAVALDAPDRTQTAGSPHDVEATPLTISGVQWKEDCMMRFNERVAIVTGAASGIGLATVQRLSSEGASVILVDRDARSLHAALLDLPAKERAFAVELDVADERAVEQCVEATLGRFGKVDILCNNAGIGGDFDRIATEQDLDEWRTVMSVNLYGTMLFTKYAARTMCQARQGAIVNTASVAGIRSGAGGNAYSASKAGVINFTQTSACDLGQWGIRVNAVCPGLVETGLTKQWFEYARLNGKEAKLGSRCELRRYGRPQELAAAITFLASDDASYITGQALAVDGGNTASLNMPGMKV